MRLRLLVAALAMLAFAPPAFATDPPYPACAPAAPFTWHAGSVVFATSPYSVQLHAHATEAWTRVGAAGTWARTPVRHDAGGDFTTIRPAFGQGALAVGFKSSNAAGACLALEERQVTVRRRVPVTGLHPVARGGEVRVSALPAGYGCHAIGGGSFTWRIDTSRGKRYTGLGTGCGPVTSDGVSRGGRRVRTTFFTLLVGNAARRGAPATFAIVRAAHPRRSGTVRFNLTGISADLPACRGCHVTHAMSAVIGVTVNVEYRPGLHPTWRTTVRFGRKLKLHPPHAGTSGNGGGGVTLGGGGSDSGGGAGDPGCSGSCS